MKEIEAIIKPFQIFKLEEVIEALSARGIEGMTVTASGGKKATERSIAAVSTPSTLFRKSKSKWLSPTAWSQIAPSAIVMAAKTGKIGAG